MSLGIAQDTKRLGPQGKPRKQKAGHRICCIPVSWPTGLGELMRLITLAQAANRCWPRAAFHFLVNRHVPEVARARIPAEFGTSLLDTSPTLDDDRVRRALTDFRPDLVLFDNAGSSRQYRSAKKLGARTVFLSTRTETRMRGFRLGALPWLDEHWIIEPNLLSTPLRRWERLKLAAAGRPTIRRLQSVFSPFGLEHLAPLTAELGVANHPYVCWVPGGGGGNIEGLSAPAIFADAAAIVARKTGAPCLLLQGPLYTGPPLDRPGVHVHKSTHEEAVALVAGAHVVVLGASSTLFQALAQKKVCVATGSGGNEQLPRALEWSGHGVVHAAAPEPHALAAAVQRLLDDAEAWNRLRQRVSALEVSNDLDRAVAAMQGLLPEFPAISR